MRRYNFAMPDDNDYLILDDKALSAQCEVHIYKASGPGGQHRNKVSSAVRLVHRPTGVTAIGQESRSQHENRRRALNRLRMKIACKVRGPVDLTCPKIPPVVRECIFSPRGPNAGPTARVKVGRKDHRFWMVAAFALDVLDAAKGRVSPAAACIGITTGNFASLLSSDRHLLAAAQDIRKHYGHKPLS